MEKVNLTKSTVGLQYGGHETLALPINTVTLTAQTFNVCDLKCCGRSSVTCHVVCETSVSVVTR
jgi:hypothetical protein